MRCYLQLESLLPNNFNQPITTEILKIELNKPTARFIYITELQISCVFAFFTLWKRVKTHVLSDQSVHITHTYYCVSKLSKFGAYLYSRVHNNTFLSEKFPVITSFKVFEGESVYIRGVPNVCLSKHRCQKRSDWMLMINHPIAVNITNKCGLRNK